MSALEPRRLLAALVSGTTYSGSLATGSQVDTYDFNASAGQRVLFAVGPTSSGSFVPRMTLVNSSNTTIATANGANGAFMEAVIPATGSYTLRVRDTSGANAGSYNVTGFIPGATQADSDTFAIESGRRRPVTIGSGNLDVYSIDATAGQYIGILATENTVGNALDLGLQVFDPSGNRVNTQTSAAGVTYNITPAVTGTYTAVLYSTGFATGIYGFSVAQLPGDQYTGDPDTAFLSPGTTRNGDLPGGDYDVFSFYAGSGVAINATMTADSSVSSALSPQLTLVGPDGTVINTTNGASTSSISGTATDAGVYYVVSRDREGDNGGRFNFNYTLSSGNGVIPTSPGGIVLNGSSGVDNVVMTISGSTLTVTTNGTAVTYNVASATRIEYQAGAGNDFIDASALNIPLYLFGGDGDDTLIGGSSDDTISGGAGRNRLYGRAGEDRLNGSSGRDFLYGEGGDDRLYGNGGSDNLDGGSNVDRLFGGDGDDLLDGGNQNDALYAGSGNDTLYGGKGTDILFGQDGNDLIYAFDLGRDTVNGGAGTDSAQLDDDDVDTLIETVLS